MDFRSGSQQQSPFRNILGARVEARQEAMRQFLRGRTGANRLPASGVMEFNSRSASAICRSMLKRLSLPNGHDLPGDLIERAEAVDGYSRASDNHAPMRSRLTLTRRTWDSKHLTRGQLAVLIFLAWTVVGVFENVPELIKRIQVYASEPAYAALGKMIEAWSWAILTPALLIIDRKMHSRGMSIVVIASVFALLSIPFALVHTYLTAILMYPLPQIYWNPLRDSDYAVYFNGGGWVHYCAAVGILEAARFYNSFLVGQLQLERVKASLLEARLNALRLHLEPHFLSNALNAISSEVEARPRQARHMIANLGILLRRSLDTQDGAEIPLAKELELLEHYLAIQRIRFGDRIDIKLEVDPGALSVAVPSMLLQPLVENAIRHGVEKRRSGGNIVVSGTIAGDSLQLSVVDDGRGLPRGWKLETSNGHGLRITRERLATLYPEWADECLSVGRCAGGGTQVTVRIPLRATGHGRANA